MMSFLSCGKCKKLSIAFADFEKAFNCILYSQNGYLVGNESGWYTRMI